MRTSNRERRRIRSSTVTFAAQLCEGSRNAIRIQSSFKLAPLYGKSVYTNETKRRGYNSSPGLRFARDEPHTAADRHVSGSPLVILLRRLRHSAKIRRHYLATR